MAARIYRNKNHACGCRTSYDAAGRLMGFREECRTAADLFTSLIRNPDRNKREATPEQVALREHVEVDPVTAVALDHAK